MIIDMLLCTVFLLFILYQITQTEKSKQEIMSVFALLSTDDVMKVYDTCDNYIDRFDNGDEVRELIQDKS